MKLDSFPRLAGGFAAVLLTASTGYAAEEQPLTIYITGSRTAQTVDEGLAPVTIIDRKQIEQRSNSTLGELLRSTPGLTITSNGGRGSQTSLFLRGTESDHTLILVDGVRIGSATTGTAAIQDIPLDQIDRIEVVRGPRSSLYGSEAIGGVIQIFTRRPSGPMQPSFSVSGGSHASYGLNAGLSGRQDSTWYSADLSSYRTDGIDACRGKPFPDGGGCFTIEPDKDGYDNNTFSAAGGVQLGERVTASANWLYIDSSLDYDGNFQNQQESTNQVLSGKLDYAATDSWNITFQAASSKDHSDNFKDGTFSSRFNTDRDQFTLQNDILAGSAGLVTVGIDYFNDKISGSTDYTVDSRDNTALFAQYLGKLASLDLQLSLRGDDNEQFGNQTTGGIAIGQDFAGGMRWTASWGSAFKAPTFNELYFPNFGNPDLSAETSDSFDIGLSSGSEQLSFSANAFVTRINDMIAYDAAANKPLNIGEAYIRGIELALGTRWREWHLDSAYTFLRPKNNSEGPYHDNLLARRPEQSLDLGIGRDFGRFDALLNLHAQGHSFDDLANTQRLAGFTTLDLSMGYAITQKWRLQLAINNLFDKQYETAKYYNQDGINGLLTLRYTPQ